MKKIYTQLLLGLLLVCACASHKVAEQCDAKQQQVAQVAAVANRELRPGLTSREVRAILGEPDDLIAYSGNGSPERWKYYQSSECSTLWGRSAPTTELMFAHGRLQTWKIYDKPLLERSADQGVKKGLD